MSSHLTARSRRVLSWAALVDSLGDGLFLAGSALFFVRGLGLPVARVGLGLSVAGVLGLALGAGIGRLADRYGPREVFVLLMLGQCAAVAAYTLVRGVPSLVLVATLASVSRQGAQAARGALIGQVGGSGAAQLRAYLHVWINIGIAAGAALAGLALAADTHAAYLALILADAATFAVAGAVALALPKVRGRQAPGVTTRRGALRDRPFLAMTGLSGVVSLQFVVTGYLLPLWVVLHTGAPRWLASPLLLLNTAVVVAAQVPVTARFPGLARAATAYRWAGATLAVGCALFALSGWHALGTAGAVCALVAAMLVISLGEVVTLAGAFGISFGFGPPEATGEYQGVWNLGFGTSVAVGPGLLTWLCLDGRAPGWLALGVLMFSAGWLLAAVADRAGRRRVRPGSGPAGVSPTAAPLPRATSDRLGGPASATDPAQPRPLRRPVRTPAAPGA